VAEATGVVMVQGQLVIVRVCDAVAVYVLPLLTKVVEDGQNVVYAVTTVVVQTGATVLLGAALGVTEDVNGLYPKQAAYSAAHVA